MTFSSLDKHQGWCKMIPLKQCSAEFSSTILFYAVPSLFKIGGAAQMIATSPFHLVMMMFVAALVMLAKSMPVHSSILSSHLVFLLVFVSLFSVELSLISQKTLRCDQTSLVFIS